MPFTPAGGVECLEHLDPLGPDEPGHWRWSEPVGVNPLICAAWGVNPKRDYDLFGRIFGDYSVGEPYPGEESLPPISQNRGLPNDLSYFIRENYEGCGRTKGETWVLWSELRDLDLTEICQRTGKSICKEWWILWEVLTLLARWYGDDKVRLVVYWNK